MANINYARRDSGLSNVVLWIIFGGLAGWIASLIVGANDQMGIPGNIIVGVIGAFIGGWIADRTSWGGEAGVERPTTAMSFVWAIVGAVILLLIANALL